ncbi:hypothetical protein ACQ4LE_006793 [Meloidogyne hapla]
MPEQQQRLPPKIPPKPKVPPKPPRKDLEDKQQPPTTSSNINEQHLEAEIKETFNQEIINEENNKNNKSEIFKRANSVRIQKSEAYKISTLPSTSIKKPSARPPPPPPPVAAKSELIEQKPRLPENPPPPPPKQFIPFNCQSSQINNKCSNSPIYEEIEADNEESNNKKLQKISSAINKNLRRRSNERRRTTQFELFSEIKINKKQNEEEDNYNDIENGGNVDFNLKNSKTSRFSNIPRSSTTDYKCENASTALANSIIVPSSNQRLSRAQDFGRFGIGIKQNLAKGMCKIRSRMSYLSSASSSPSPSFKNLGNKRNDLSTMTLDRQQQKCFNQSNKKQNQFKRNSTFYLDEDEENNKNQNISQQEKIVKMNKNEEEEEEFESKLLIENDYFADDWSSSTETSNLEEREAEEDMAEANSTFEDSSPAAHRPSLQEEIQLALERLKHGGEPSFISMKEEKVLSKSLEVNSTKMESNKASKTLLENNYQVVDEHKTTNEHLNLTEKLEENDDFEEQLSTKFLSNASLYSKLPEQQPLYQIYLLQEQQRLAESLEPIEEVLNIGKKKINKRKEKKENEVKGEGEDEKKNDEEEEEKDEEELADEIDSGCPETEEHPSDPASISRSCSASNSSAVVRRDSSSTTDSGRADSLIIRPLRRERLLGQSIFASQRSLWCELQEVKESGLLERMDEDQRKLQEAYFEVITSEASYLRSISFLISHFMSAPELMGSKNTQSVITNSERKQLFSNILAIRDCSDRLLSELETRLKQGLILTDICDILCAHFETQFEPYINYCSNQEYQDRTLKKLRTENALFNACIQKLEKDRQCHGLDIRSFLMLPMQRITRYPLLIDAILQWLHQDQHQHSLATRALTLANQAVHNCNEGARRMEHTEKMLDIESRLVYKCKDLKRIPLVTNGRYVVKSGQLIQLAEKRNGESKTKLALAARSGGVKARPLAFFLFNDLLLITKRRLNGQFVCKDYAFRRFVVFEPLELNNLRVPPGVTSALGSGRNAHLLSCVLFQNARGRQVELLLSAENESDRERWLTAMRPPTCANPDEKIYEEWDCPQAVAAHNYVPTEEDQLGLSPGDVVNVLRKLSDGWYYGERIRDKRGGWFPSSYVQQLMNDHVRAQKYRQRFRVLQSASEYRSSMHFPRGKRSSLATILPSFVTSSSSNNSTNNSIIASTSGTTHLRRLSNPRAYFS